jgi:uncharacterized protein (TIGR02246 family)
MRRISGFWVISLCVAGLARAQAPTPAVPTADAAVAPAPDAHAAQHDALRQLQATMETALNARDLDAIVANVDENVVFTTMNGDVARGRDGVRQYFAKMMEGPDKVVETVTSDFIPDELSIFYGEDTAIAFGGSNDHYVLTDGRKFDIHARWTATLVQKDGRWLVAAFHYSTNVFDNPILTMQRKYLIAGGAGGALVLGLLGFFIGRKTGRRSG